MKKLLIICFIILISLSFTLATPNSISKKITKITSEENCQNICLDKVCSKLNLPEKICLNSRIIKNKCKKICKMQESLAQINTDPQTPKSCPMMITENTILTQDYTSTSTCITINASNIILDCQNHKIESNGNGNGIIATNQNNVTIKNCIMENFENGIHLQNTNQSFIQNNFLKNNQKGIFISFSSENEVTNNNATENTDGIYLEQGTYNLIENNQASKNSNAGINLNSNKNLHYDYCSDNNILQQNTLSRNKEGLFMHCEYLNQPENNLIQDNIFIGNKFSSMKEYYPTNTIAQNTYLNNLNNVFFETNLNHSLKVHQQKEFEVAVFYSNGEPCNTFTINNIETNPQEIVNYIQEGNQIYGYFQPNRNGLYSLNIDIKGCGQNQITQRYYFGNLKTQRFYLAEGSRNDEGYFVLEPPITPQHIWCTMWVQGFVKNSTDDSGILKLTSIDTSIVYHIQQNMTGVNSIFAIQNILSFSRERDVSLSINPTGNEFQRSEKHFETGWFIHEESEWQDIGIKMEGLFPDWISEPGNLSYIDVSYLYTENPILNSISNKDIQIISSTTPSSDSINPTKIILQGTGETNLNVEMSQNKEYEIYLNNHQCGEVKKSKGSKETCEFEQTGKEIEIFLNLENNINEIKIIPE